MNLNLHPEVLARNVIAMFRCAGIAYSRGQTSYATQTASMATYLLGMISGVDARTKGDLIEAERFYQRVTER